MAVFVALAGLALGGGAISSGAVAYPPGTKAMVIGASEFPKLEQFNIPGAEKDALNATRRLESLGFTVSSMAGLVTRLQVRTGLNSASQQPTDTYLLFFSGRGVINSDGSASLCLGDSDARPETMLRGDELADALSRLPCRRLIVVIDTCYASSFLYQIASRLDRVFLTRDRCYALFGASKGLAYESPEGGFYSTEWLRATATSLPRGATARQTADSISLGGRGEPWQFQEPVFLQGGRGDEPLFMPIASRTSPAKISFVEPNTRAGSATSDKPKVPVRVKLDKSVKRVLIDGEEATFVNGSFFGLVSATQEARTVKVEAFAADGSKVEQAIRLRYDPKLERKTFQMGEHHALVIGVDDYTHVRKLTNAVNDANDVATRLEQRFGFKVKRLRDKEATYDGITQALRDLPQNPPPNSQLMVYFAGHGYEDTKLTSTAFICPVDTQDISGSATGTMLQLRFIQQVLSERGFRQTLLVADSCFSGTMRRIDGGGDADLSPAWRAATTQDHDWREIEDLMLNPSCHFIGAGRPEVPDIVGGSKHSPFTQALLDCLDEEREMKTFSYLRERLRTTVTEPRPQFGTFAGMPDTGSEFVLISQKRSDR